MLLKNLLYNKIKGIDQLRKVLVSKIKILVRGKDFKKDKAGVPTVIFKEVRAVLSTNVLTPLGSLITKLNKQL
jgi:hypothetical protein